MRGPRTILLRPLRQLVEKGAPVIVDKEAEARPEVEAPAAEEAVVPPETAVVKGAPYQTTPWWLSCNC